MGKRILLGLAALGLIVGCGGKPSGPSGTMSKEAAGGLISSGGAATTLLNSSNIHSAATQTGFKVNFITTFACEVLGFAFSGNTTIADANDSIAHNGFTASINDYTFSGGEASFTMNGTSTYSRTGGTGTGSLEITASLDASGQGAEFGYYRDVTVTLNNADNSLAGGEVAFSGFLVYEVGDFSFTLQASTEANLVYDAITRPGSDRISIYQSGVINFKDGDENTLKMTVTNGTAAWEYNGEAITASR